MNGSHYQHRYWNKLAEMRVHAGYLHHYAAWSDSWDKLINIFMAITSSGSIAAWAVWKEVTYVWPALIAMSQAVTAIKPFLPFRQRQRMVTELGDQFQTVLLSMERDWFGVAEGRCTDEEIHHLISKYSSQTVAAERKCMKGTILPRKPKLMAKAENDTRQYFENNYPGEHDE